MIGEVTITALVLFQKTKTTRIASETSFLMENVT
jgi:hypothetical protein